MNIIGIAAFFHDSSCCLLQDGKLIAAVEEERFSRVKHDSSLPKRAFRYCLNAGGLTLSDIDCIAFYENPSKKVSRQIWSMFSNSTIRPEIINQIDLGRPEREICNTLGYEGPIEFVDHHHSHAASSYYFSGFPEAAVLTVDGVGEWATTTYGLGTGPQLSILEEVCFPDSLGLLYTALTTYLGFAANDGEYKVMGLAPYGQPNYTRQIETLIHSSSQGQFELDLRFFDFLSNEVMYTDALPELMSQPARAPNAPLTKFHMDVACSLQKVLEHILLDKVHYLHSTVPSDNLCMAGGVALNCVANGRILKEGPFRRMFVPPAAGDGGGSIGAAALAYMRRSNSASCEPLTDAYLGPSFDSGEIELLLKSPGVRAVDYRDGDESELLFATAARLAAGQVVGWFQGRMEYGPRALGSRSILADPRRVDMRDRINQLVKKREEFRPFAPAVLADAAANHFELDHLSPFMLETCQVRSPLELPAITHVDGSARVQTVTEQSHPRFAGLLRTFEHLTGCPILLNTSFNMRDEPIVCTPLDALICFIRSQLDALVIGDFVVDRTVVRHSFSELMQHMKPKRSSVPDNVYTLF